MRRRIVPVVGVLAIAALAWTFWKGRTPGAEAGSTFYGNVDIREVNLGFRVAGRVARMRKDEGDSVKAGEVLAVLDEVPFRNQLDRAKAELAAAEAVLALRRKGNRPEEISQVEALLAERKATLENARIELDRQKSLVARHAVSQQAYDDAAALYREASARYDSTAANLRLLEAGFRAEEIAQAEANVASAEAAVETAETDLADATLVAAEDGIVMTRAVEPGAIVQAGSTVFTVNLERPVWVRAYVSEPYLGRVQPGGKVEIFTDLHPDKPYHGQIGYVSPRAEFTPKSVETTDLRTALVYRFRVVVTDADGALRQGMPVTVRLVED